MCPEVLLVPDNDGLKTNSVRVGTGPIEGLADVKSRGPDAMNIGSDISELAR